MWTTEQYRTLVRASGWYDLLVTLAFVTPWSFMALHGLLQDTAQALHLAGSLPPFEPTHLLMANLMGSIVCVWAVLRIRDPQQAFGRYDAVGRILFASWQVYALMHGATALIWGILLVELAWCVAQLLPVKGCVGKPAPVGRASLI
ncbi:hypothetical protein DNK59_13725 [Pseudomonas sp. TKO26]|uniref:hypothetical protein n=1 Tax=unclassified Pseudomonas TaxID=196821 RepID=UPI000D9B04F5|nr:MULTISPECIES: hypothetical protein [unclassified Pseudomonas]PYY85718.1 hypothetical protein DNK62_13725 [Pseudomonas sp. TKO30]PYY88131.1 hypothetical protein DNK61_13720 [Pseudomonas sp. TKO29]PYY91114.1 hypothetical protein DNK59_13725 [Pseudomonas sp. TKO26]PYY99562.1 hypothetical protein DNK60_13720 [Pseudomonas sp. TKO14]